MNKLSKGTYVSIGLAILLVAAMGALAQSYGANQQVLVNHVANSALHMSSSDRASMTSIEVTVSYIERDVKQIKADMADLKKERRCSCD